MGEAAGWTDEGWVRVPAGVALDRLLAEVGIRPLGRRAATLLRRRAGWIRLGAEDDVLGRIRRVQEYVEVNVGEVRALDDLAEVAGLSRYHFARRFREAVGEPPWAYVRRVRAEEAVRRLKEGEAPADVAYDTGFADQSHLTRELKQRYGTTPGQIARRGVATAGEDSKPVQDDPAQAA